MEDVHEVARALPSVKLAEGGRAVYQVSGRSFVFFRTPRPDAVDPETGERYDDVICLWVESEEAKRALVDDDSTPYFTTPHFDGHPSVLLRASRIAEVERDELVEIVQEAWLAQASGRRRSAWLESRGLPGQP